MAVATGLVHVFGVWGLTTVLMCRNVPDMSGTGKVVSTETKRLPLVLNADDRAALERQAARESRNLTDQIRFLIRQHDKDAA